MIRDDYPDFYEAFRNMIRDDYPGSGMTIPDPDFSHPGSRGKKNTGYRIRSATLLRIFAKVKYPKCALFLMTSHVLCGI
jgi:hypothetical protein